MEDQNNLMLRTRRRLLKCSGLRMAAPVKKPSNEMLHIAGQDFQKLPIPERGNGKIAL